MSASDIYDEFYYRHGCGAQPYERNPGWLRFFAGIAARIARDIQPGSALDAGCAMGFLVEGLRDLGVEAYGVDVSDYALQQVRPDVRAYCWRGSVLDPFPRNYDLIVCIEVLEHLAKPDSERALANLCRFTDDILFSSSPGDYREATHFNVQAPEYWAEQFAHQGFIRDVDFDASFITPWAVRFRRSREPLPRVVAAYERRFWQAWKENVDLRDLSLQMRQQLADQESQLTGQVQQLDAMNRELTELRGYLAGTLGRGVAWLDRALGWLVGVALAAARRVWRWLRGVWRALRLGPGKDPA
jgi:SAM-dependent methyltransferase